MAGGCKAPTTAAAPERLPATDAAHAARPFHSPHRQSSPHYRLAGPHLERRNSLGRDFLRPPAPGLSRQSPNPRALLLVPRFRIEAALAALAPVFRRRMGPLRPGFGDRHYRAGEIQAA